MERNPKNPVYFSYAHNEVGMRYLEKPVDELCDMFSQKGIVYCRDKEGLCSNGTNFGEIADIIGSAKVAIVVVSARYLQSLNCMYEWYCICEENGFDENEIQRKVKFVFHSDNDVNKPEGKIRIQKQLSERLQNIRSKQLYEMPQEEKLFIRCKSIDKALEVLHYIASANKQEFEGPKKNAVLENVLTAIEMRLTELDSEDSDKKKVKTNTNTIIPSFKFNITQNLIARDNAVKELHDLVNKYRVTNLCGFGGSGKTSLVNLFAGKNANEFNQIVYIVVNNSVKADFVSQINDTIHLFKPEENAVEDVKNIKDLSKIAEQSKEKEDRYKKIISFLENNYKSDKPNLLIIDINNAPDGDAAKFGEELATQTLPSNKIYPDGWKYLIVSRENIYNGIAKLNLNEKESENKEFLKNLFLENAGREKYKDFSDDDFSIIFQKIFYNPLMTEQLGVYLKDKEVYSSASICKLLDEASFKQQKRVGITSQNRNSNEEKTIIGFLRDLVVFDNLKKGEQLLLKHLVLWPSDYIPEGVIKMLLAKSFKAETNRWTKLWSIIKHYFDFSEWGTNRIGAFYNKTNKVKVPKIWFYLSCVIIVLLLAFSAIFKGHFTSGLLLSIAFVSIFILVEIKAFHCTFRPIQRIVSACILWLLIGLFLPYSKILNLITLIFSLIMPSLPVLLQNIFHCFSSKKYLQSTDKEDYIDAALFELLQKRFISQKTIENQKHYKLHGLIAESIREQIDFAQTDYTNYLETLRKTLKYDDKDFEPFAQCIGYSMCNKSILITNYSLFDIAYNLNDTSYTKIKESLFKRFIEESNECYDNSEKNRLADAYLNLAILQHLKLNNYPNAYENYNETIKISERLPKRNHIYQHRLALAYNNLANLQYTQLHEYYSAKENCNNAILIWNNLINKKLKYHYFLAMAYNNLATLQNYYLKDYTSAQNNYNKAIAIRETLPKDNPIYQDTLANSYNALAELQEKQKDYTSAQDNYNKAIEIRETLPKDNTEYQSALANLYNHLANLQKNYLNDYSSAQQNYNRTIEICSNLPKEEAIYQRNLAISHLNLAHLQIELKKYTSAQESHTKAITILEQLPNDNPDYQNQLALSHSALADLQTDYLNDYPSAQDNYDKAIIIMENLSKDQPNYLNDLANLYNDLAKLQTVYLNNYPSAQNNYNKAIEIGEKLPKDNPDYQNNLANLYNAIANLQQYYLNDYTIAKDNYTKAISIYTKLPENEPICQRNLAISYRNLANLQEKLKKYTSAQEYYNKAIEIQEKLPKDNPDYQYDLASSYKKLAILQENKLQDYQSAFDNYKKAIIIGEKLSKDNPDYQNKLAGSYNTLAYCYDKLKNYDDAIKSVTTAIEIAANLKDKDSKYLIDWVGYSHSLCEIKFNNGKDLDEVKSTLLKIKPLAQKCLDDNPDDEWTKQTNNDIDELLAKFEE